MTKMLLAVLLLAASAAAQEGGLIEISAECGGQPARYSVRLWPSGSVGSANSVGSVRFAGLAAGRYRLEFACEDGAAADTIVDLASGQSLRLEVTFEPLVMTLPEVVTACEHTPASIQTITRAELENSRAGTLADFLSQRGSLDMQSEGIPGAQTGLRIGASSTNQVTVLVDGRRLVDHGTGVADLSAIPIEWVERVEIYRGARSEHSGEGIGGIVAITTREPIENGGWASETTWRETSQRFSVSSEGMAGGIGGLISYTRLQGPNDFRFRITEEDGTGEFTPNLRQTYRRQNAHVARDQVFGKLSGGFGGAWQGALVGSMDRTTRAMPGYLAPFLTPEASQKTTQSAINAQAMRAGAAMDWRARISYQDSWREFRNPASLASVTHSLDASRVVEAEGYGRYKAQKAVLEYGVQSGRESMESANLSGGAGHRNRWAAWTNHRRLLAESGSASVAVDAGLRGEGFGSRRSLLPKAGVVVAQSGSWPSHVSIYWGRSYRAPDFFALFWQDDQVAAGNPDLQPETSDEWTALARIDLRGQSRMHVEVSVSSQTIEDLIQWKRTFDNRWRPVNLRSASVRTADISAARYLVLDRWQIQAGASWTEARDATDDRNTGGKYLTFRPLNGQRASVTYRGRGLHGSVAWRRVSKRPVLETNSKWLAAYQLVDASIGAAVRIRQVELAPVIGVNNLLDEDYRIIRFAPMPLREWYLSINIKSI